MQKFSRVSIYGLVFVSLMFSVSCGKSRSALKKADSCPTKYKAISLTSKNFKEKTTLKKGEALTLAPGKYKYLGSEFYINDKNRDLRIHLTHKAADTGAGTKDVACVGGKAIRDGMEPFEFQLPFISSIISSTSGKNMISEGLVTLSFKPNKNLPWISYEIKDKSDEKKEGSVKDLYTEFTASEQIFVALKKSNKYEYRALLNDISSNKSDKSLPEREVRVLVSYELVAE